MIEMTDLDKQILLNKIELYAEYLALADRIKGETCLINDFKTKCWLIKKSTKHDLKAQELFKQIEEKILRGRDDLNSNKTPKEFCKDKDCVAKGEDKMNNKEVIKKLKELKYVLDFTNTEYLEYAIKKLEE